MKTFYFGDDGEDEDIESDDNNDEDTGAGDDDDVVSDNNQTNSKCYQDCPEKGSLQKKTHASTDYCQSLQSFRLRMC